MANSKWTEAPVKRSVWVMLSEEPHVLSYMFDTAAELPDIFKACQILFPDMLGLEITPEKSDEQKTS